MSQVYRPPALDESLLKESAEGQVKQSGGETKRTSFGQMPSRSIVALVGVLVIAVIALAITLIVVYAERLPCSDSKSQSVDADMTFPSQWLRVIGLSDIHLDISYTDSASALVSKYPCHNLSSPTQFNFSAMFGRAKCDSPKALLDSALDGIIATDRGDPADLVLITGDKSGHFLYEDTDGTNFNGTMVLEAQKVVSLSLAAKFPDRRVIMTMGNNDVPQHWQIPESWWYEELYGLWSPLILCKQCREDRFGVTRNVNEREFNSTFLRGGYYKVTVTPQLDFLMLNTLYWTSYAWYTTKPWRQEIADIANEQMKWLADNLVSASLNGRKVLVVAHVPVGLDPFRVGKQLEVRQFWFDNYTALYMQLLKNHHTVLAGQAFAHLHKDDVRVYSASSSVHLPAILMPSISPIYNNNPSFRWMYFSSEDSQLADYTQYWGDVVEGNVDKQMMWRKDYTFSQAYPSTTYKTITGDRLVSLWKLILGNYTVWTKYMYHRQCHFANAVESYSRDHLYCVAVSSTLTEYNACRKKYPADPYS